MYTGNGFISPTMNNAHGEDDDGGGEENEDDEDDACDGDNGDG